MDFWQDRWFGDEQLIEMATMSNPPQFLVPEFFGANGWNVEKLSTWLPTNVVVEISTIPIGLQVPDRIMWANSSDVHFHLASTWEYIRQRSNHSIVTKVVWCQFCQ